MTAWARSGKAWLPGLRTAAGWKALPAVVRQEGRALRIEEVVIE